MKKQLMFPCIYFPQFNNIKQEDVNKRRGQYKIKGC